MHSPSRLRLSAGILALALTLGACGAPEQQSAAPAPESTSAPATSSSPADATGSSASTSSVASPSASASSTAAAADTASASPADGSTDDATVTAARGPAASSSESAAGSATRSGAAGSSSRTAAPSASSSDSSAPHSSTSAAAQQRPAPVVADPTVVPPAQDLGGPKPGVAPSDTPVKVSTPKPAIPVERVPPAAAHPAPVAPSTSTPRPTSPSSGSSATPGAPRPGASPSAAPAPAPTGPVSDAGVDCSVKRCIALTFDDGPGRYTGRLLDILKAQKVPATFYVMGQSATLNPSLIARMGAEGHQVGNHTYDHANLTTLTAAQVRKEISDTDAAVRAAGVTPSTVRAPYGALNESVLAALGGLPRAGSVTWNVDTLDWKHRTPAKTLAAVKNEARPGSIVLMHDIHSTTVDAVPAVIAHLRAQGYTFVTVDRITGGVSAGHTTGSGLHP